MPGGVAVVSDSTVCLPQAMIDSLGIEVVSLYYDLGQGPRPELELGGRYESFFEELPGSSGTSTSPPTVEDFAALYDRALAEHESIVSVHISSGVSDTCANARQAGAAIAQRDGRERVTVIDSAGSAGHMGCQVIAAARAAAAGAAVEQVVERVRQARQGVKLWFVVDTLEYLRRGGRIGTAAAWIGSALDIKPVLSIESEIVPVERVRTRARGVERLIELVRQRRAQGAERWFAHHAHCEDDLQELVDRATQLFGAPPEFVSEVGPVIAVHTGPGALWLGSVPGAALD